MSPPQIFIYFLILRPLEDFFVNAPQLCEWDSVALQKFLDTLIYAPSCFIPNTYDTQKLWLTLPVSVCLTCTRCTVRVQLVLFSEVE